LFAFGYTKTKLTGNKLFYGVAKTIFVGIITTGAAYLIAGQIS
jgi:hypothetical protein